MQNAALPAGVNGSQLRTLWRNARRLLRDTCQWGTKAGSKRGKADLIFLSRGFALNAVIHLNNSTKAANLFCFDFLRPLMFSLCDSSAHRCAVINKFGLPLNTDAAQLSAWLMERARNHSKFMNMHLVALWVFADCEGNNWYSE
jgi:hypothetical protein